MPALGLIFGPKGPTTETQEVMVATLDRAWPGLSIVV